MLTGPHYIATNEIRGELSRENVISAHLKITCYFQTCKDDPCCGCMVNGAFRSQNRSVKVKWFGTSSTSHGRARITWFAALSRELFFNTQRVSLLGHVIFSVYQRIPVATVLVC